MSGGRLGACILIVAVLAWIGGSVTGGGGATIPAAKAAGPPPANIQPPSIVGTPKPGETLTSTPGSWTGDPAGYSYKWQSCYPGGCLARQESGEPTYVVEPTDALQSLSVAVTATDDGGSATATSSTVKVEPSWHYATGPPRRETISWAAPEPPPPWSLSDALTIGIGTGMCVGEVHFRFGSIKVHERAPSRRFPFPSAVITTSIVWPAPTEIVGTVNPGEVQPACAGIGVGAGRTIRLKRPASRLFIYDGSRNPPQLVVRPPMILPWKLERKVGPRTIEVAVPFEACAGVSVSTHLVERPGRAIITAYGVSPRHPGPGRCIRVRGVEDLRVRLHSKLDDLKLFDGSRSPPLLREH